MFTKKQVSLLAVALASISFGGAAVAANANNNMSVSADLSNSCTITTSTMTFDSVAGLFSSSAVNANNGTTLVIACTSGTTPKLYATGTRKLSDGTSAHDFAFALSANNPATTDDYPSTAGSGVAVTADGDTHAVSVYGQIKPADFGNKPAGHYTATISMNVDY